jgi:hypothetical protein
MHRRKSTNNIDTIQRMGVMGHNTKLEATSNTILGAAHLICVLRCNCHLHRFD